MVVVIGLMLSNQFLAVRALSVVVLPRPDVFWACGVSTVDTKRNPLPDEGHTTSPHGTSGYHYCLKPSGRISGCSVNGERMTPSKPARKNPCVFCGKLI